MKKSFLFLLLPFSILIIQLFFPYLEREMIISSENIEKMEIFLSSFMLPISIILWVIILVEEDRKVSGRKRTSYIFAYFIFIPFILVSLVYNLLY